MEKERARNWLVTKHFKDGFQEDTRTWIESFFRRSKAVYMVGQLEQGLKEEKLHIQAYANFKDAKNLGGLKKVDDDANFKVVVRDNGAGDYCMKEFTRVEGPYEFGVKPVRRNNKNDWEEVLQKAKDGKFDEIPASILVQNYGNITKLYKDHMKVEDSNHLRGIFIYGQSGVGKSTLARQLFPGLTLYNKAHNKWWDSYKGEKVVIWDDISPEETKISGTHLKLYCDRYGVMGETKGSGVPLTHDYFIMTSQYSFEECFPDIETRQAMERRCYIYEMIGPFGDKFVMSDMIEKLYDTSKKIDAEDFIIR